MKKRVGGARSMNAVHEAQRPSAKKCDNDAAVLQVAVCSVIAWPGRLILRIVRRPGQSPSSGQRGVPQDSKLPAAVTWFNKADVPAGGFLCKKTPLKRERNNGAEGRKMSNADTSSVGRRLER